MLNHIYLPYINEIFSFFSLSYLYLAPFYPGQLALHLKKNEKKRKQTRTLSLSSLFHDSDSLSITSISKIKKVVEVALDTDRLGFCSSSNEKSFL